MTLTLLIAEDDADIATMVTYGARLLWPDCRVDLAADGDAALRHVADARFDLVVLDVSMPPPDGFAVLAHIRETSRVPILMLTAKARTADKIRAFDLGADDYLTKPYDPLELLARLRALVRRAQLAPESPGIPPASPSETTVAPPPLRVDGLTLDPLTRTAQVRGQVVALTATETRLLEELARHAGRTLPHTYLLTRVWGVEYADDVTTLRVCVGRLRAKLGDGGESDRYIHTDRNLGYHFAPPR